MKGAPFKSKCTHLRIGIKLPSSEIIGYDILLILLFKSEFEFGKKLKTSPELMFTSLLITIISFSFFFTKLLSELVKLSFPEKPLLLVNK